MGAAATVSVYELGSVVEARRLSSSIAWSTSEASAYRSAGRMLSAFAHSASNPSDTVAPRVRGVGRAAAVPASMKSASSSPS